MEDCVSQELALNPEEYEVSGSTHNANTKAPKQARINAAKMVLLNCVSLSLFMEIFVMKKSSSFRVHDETYLYVFIFLTM